MLVDETSAQQFHLINLRVVGIYTSHRGIQVEVAPADIGDGLIHRAYLVDMLLELICRRRNIALLQRDATTLFQSLIGFGCLTAEDHDGVGQETAVLLQLGIDESVAGTQQHHEHEDAPGYSKASKCRPQFITLGRTPYLTQ